MGFIDNIFTHINLYIELMPVFCAGIFAGVISWANYSEERRLWHSVKVVITCAFIASLCYAILSASDLPYLAKVGLSTAVGYFGIDRAIDLVNKILSIRNLGNNINHKDTPHKDGNNER